MDRDEFQMCVKAQTLPYTSRVVGWWRLKVCGTDKKKVLVAGGGANGVVEGRQDGTVLDGFRRGGGCSGVLIWLNGSDE